MSSLRRIFRQTFTIARRDFVATVFTPTFLLFLLAPLMMLAFGTVGGLGAASMAKSGGDKVRLVMIADGPRALSALDIDRDLRRIYRAPERPPRLILESPGADPAAQARALFNRKDIEASAVLYGPLEKPVILYGPAGDRTADYMAVVAEQVLRAERAGEAILTAPVKTQVARTTSSASGQGQAGFFTVFALFIVSLMLAGQVVGTMAEERSNKVIEVLAAAVPLESVFFGKLLGMFGVALLFLLFWGTVVVNVGQLLPAGRLASALADIGPATGFATFAFLFFAYFVMAYMLLGAVFLGIGAQASTQRELQMLSLPITIFQMAMFGFAVAAVSSPDSWVATAAELFPFSSPFAMAARAANSPDLWPHALALGWQALWVVVTVTIAARLFRRGVLQSGSPKRRRKKAVATPV